MINFCRSNSENTSKKNKKGGKKNKNKPKKKKSKDEGQKPDKEEKLYEIDDIDLLCSIIDDSSSKKDKGKQERK